MLLRFHLSLIRSVLRKDIYAANIVVLLRHLFADAENANVCKSIYYMCCGTNRVQIAYI